MKKIVILIGVFAFLAGCKKSDVDQSSLDRAIIQQYIKDSSLVADSTASGLYYVIADSGIGANPNSYSVVTVYYKGYLINGSIFDQNLPGLPTELSLIRTIKGWQEGIPLIKKGGRIKLLIPSSLGYGSSANGSIPANSVLVFDVELSTFR